MNNNENPNTVQPTNNGVPTVTPTVGPVPANPLPTVVPTETVPTEIANSPVSDPRGVGIDNKEFIHPEAFDKVNAPKDDNSVVNEKLKKVEVEYTPPSNFKLGLMVVFFVFLIAFVLFLPEITSIINLRFSKNNDDKWVKITDGSLNCYLNTNTTNLDKRHEYRFNFKNNKLERLEYTVTTKGDPTLDAKSLDKLAGICKQLSQDTESIIGVTVRCNYTEGKLVETQSFDLKDLDMAEVRSSYAEAGGTNPEYPYGQDMDLIESSLKASGYDCKRES